MALLTAETLLQDLRYSLRLLAKNPSFTAIAVVTLALGIGANAAVFSLVNAVLLRPLPYTEADRIVTVWSAFPQSGVRKFGVAYKNVQDWKERSDVFEPLAIYQAASNTSMNLTALSGPVRVQGTRSTGDFFRALNVQPFLGRLISGDDEQPGRDHVVVVGYNLWQHDFGSNAQIIGHTIRLNDEDYEVVGVMPPGFQFPSGLEMPAGQQFATATEVWIPLTIPNATTQNDRVTNSFRAVARLKRGVSNTQAQTEMSAITRQMVTEHRTDLDGLEVVVSTMQENQVGELRPALLLLLAAVGFVLLIACVNIANLLLSRASARQREFVIRAALGASRRRIVQQLLTDSLVLGMVGGTLGLVLALIANRLVIAFAPTNIPRLNEVAIDLRVLVFTILVSMTTGLIFGLAPAFHATRANLQQGMREGTRSVAGSSHSWLRGLLVVSEVMLVFVLLVAAGLMLRSFRRLMDVAPGFDADNVLTARVALPARTYPGTKMIGFYQELLDRLHRQSGVKSAALVRDLPFSGTDPRYGVLVDGRSADSQNGGFTFRYRIISADYFKAMGIPLDRGRYFDSRDDQKGANAVIINETAAHRMWPNEDPIGQVILPIGPIAPARCVVVGIVGDVKFGGLDTQPDIELFFPFSQIPEPVISPVIGSMAILVRTTQSPETLARIIRDQVAALNKDIPVSSIATLSELQSGSVASRRFQMMMLALFALGALILTIVGIYGVVSYWVVQKTQEIGIRIALGAQPAAMLRFIIVRGMALAVIGIILGLGGALSLTRLMTSLLFGIGPTDPLTFIVVALLLAGTALTACLFPAWRAMRVDPVVALRAE
jgi:putative ABC transport system permease protein